MNKRMIRIVGKGVLVLAVGLGAYSVGSAFSMNIAAISSGSHRGQEMELVKVPATKGKPKEVAENEPPAMDTILPSLSLPAGFMAVVN
ncbi:MAG: hypothetical protein D6E12_05470 [Desulfovibrio sp.]|nr:MAG: hypothetical protein D6E12_05470 [Desulfovibrio sp.]